MTVSGGHQGMLSHLSFTPSTLGGGGSSGGNSCPFCGWEMKILRGNTVRPAHREGRDAGPTVSLQDLSSFRHIALLLELIIGSNSPFRAAQFHNCADTIEELDTLSGQTH